MPHKLADRPVLSAAGSIVAIAAVYAFFLLFAEFAFLELARPHFGTDTALRPLLAVLGVGGIAGSFLAAVRFRPPVSRRALVGGFAGCALSAAASLAWRRLGFWLPAAAVGLSLGWTTVILSARLRDWAPAGYLGRCCGWGTGLAYATSNFPALFSSRPETQTATAIGFALVGGIAAGLAPAETRHRPPAAAPIQESGVGWGVIFLALVWLDSAGFYILQHTPRLRAATWAGSVILYGNAGTHFVGAALAGIALDARRIGAAVLVAIISLAAADGMLGAGIASPAARAFYTVGVSAYSAALVFFPASQGKPLLAAALFSVAGWGGSALGIGMVQNLQTLPPWFVALATAVVIAGLAVRRVRRRKFALSAATLLAIMSIGATRARSADDPIARGRQVYISEGCINCHSQYIRPSVPQEILWWGPVRPLSSVLAEEPPLLGLRRQGPDLMNVGNRRSPDWQRVHLVAPSQVSPGSRMPSYSRLFAAGSERGNDLVAYLASLGAETMPERMEAVGQWIPPAEAGAPPFDAAKAQALFAQLCAACHGPAAHGDGPLVSQLWIKPPDFSRDPWRHPPADQAQLLSALERIIKFGLPGTAMAGREYLDDYSVILLAQYVRRLHH